MTGEPLPLDLLNTTWVSGGRPQDLWPTRPARGSGSTSTASTRPATRGRVARAALREAREALRALVQDRTAIDGVNPCSRAARNGRN